RVPRDQLMRPHYVFTSPRRCDLFDLRVRFDPARLPDRVWRVSEAFHRDVDDPGPSDDLLTVDSAGELHVEFHDVRPGFGYGARWSAIPSYEMLTSPGLAANG